MSYPLPIDEPARLAALYRYDVLDTEAEASFDDLVTLASQICGTPMSLVSLVDAERQWFKAKVGLDATETSREVSFCAHALMEPEELFVVRDATADARFAQNPLVTGELGIRFYAGAPLVTADGHAIGTLCAIDHIARDLTGEQKEALRMLARQVVSQLELRLKVRELQKRTEELAASEAALQTSRAYLNAVLDAAVDFSIIAARPDGIITVFNAGAQRMLGYAADEMIGLQTPAIIHLESEVVARGRQLSAELGREVAGFDVFVERPRSNLPEDQEWTYIRKDGSQLTVRLVVTALRDERGAITDFLGVAHDITTRKKAEEERARLLRELESANTELKDFAHVVSHDLKAPLRAIGSLADWIATDYADKLDVDGREQLALLVGRTKRMHALIDGILQYSRAGRMHEEKSVTDLQKLVSDVIDLLAPPPHITVKIEGTLPVVACERTRTTQVFQNLISNAIKYLDKPKGEVRIGCTDQSRYFHFSVSDNGPGIDAKYFERIFQLFQTLAPRDQVESTGVGLSVVKKIIDAGGGHVWVESELGTGSTFHFTLAK